MTFPVEILHKRVMVTHDVVIKVWQKAWNSNPGVGLGMRMCGAKLKRIDREMNPRACPVTCLSCELVVCPQGSTRYCCTPQ